MSLSRPAKWSFAASLLLLLAAASWIAYRTWPRPLHAPAQTKFQSISIASGRLSVALPTDALVADLGPYGSLANTFLYLDYLRSQSQLDSTRLMVCSPPAGDSHQPPRMYLSVDNDLLTSLPYLYSLTSDATISEFSLQSWSNRILNRCKDETVRFEALFRIPVFLRLSDIPDAQLIAPLAEFLVFKSATDRRVRARSDPTIAVLTEDQARELAEDMIVVARFYALPLEYFLGIGAVENNYMNVRGDLDHAVWKRRPQPLQLSNRARLILRDRAFPVQTPIDNTLLI